MGENYDYLITILYNYCRILVRVALKLKEGDLSENAISSPMDHRKEYYKYLPEHVKSMGEIVNIEKLFWIGEAVKERLSEK